MIKHLTLLLFIGLAWGQKDDTNSFDKTDKTEIQKSILLVGENLGLSNQDIDSFSARKYEKKYRICPIMKKIRMPRDLQRYLITHTPIGG